MTERMHFSLYVRNRSMFTNPGILVAFCFANIGRRATTTHIFLKSPASGILNVSDRYLGINRILCLPAFYFALSQQKDGRSESNEHEWVQLR